MIRFYFQDIGANTYTEDAAMATTAYGQTDTQTNATASPVEGFTAEAVTQLNIAGDGSTEVRVYYTRNNYDLTFKANGGKWGDGTSADKTISTPYGKAISAPAVSRDLYTFTGWSPALASGATMPASDAAYTAQWVFADVGVTAVSVSGVAGVLSGTDISVELPYGSAISADPASVSITLANAGASHTDPPVTTNGGATWTFTVTAADGQTSADYTITVTVAGRKPVFTTPDGDQTVEATEGQTVTLTVAVADDNPPDPASLQWQVDKGDGNGFVNIGGETGASYVISPAGLQNNGWQYRCAAVNTTGESYSPVFTLGVRALPTVPQTGDGAPLGLWMALMLACAAGMVTLARKKA